MTDTPQNQENVELREKLAAIEHERWADWQKWMHQKVVYAYACYHCGDDASMFRLPVEAMHRWNKQIETPYSELSELEKASDMEQVDRYWHLIEEYVEQEKQALLSSLVEIINNEYELSITDLELKQHQQGVEIPVLSKTSLLAVIEGLQKPV
jgi:hypothetical protein